VVHSIGAQVPDETGLVQVIGQSVTVMVVEAVTVQVFSPTQKVVGPVHSLVQLAWVEVTHGSVGLAQPSVGVELDFDQ
jgi:hypothetical protein